MKKLLIFLALILSVVGCSNDNSQSNSINSTQSREIEKITNKYYFDSGEAVTYTTTFTYDILKRITSITEEFQGVNVTALVEQNITYLADGTIKIVETESYDNEELSTIEITMTVGLNGYVSTIDGKCTSLYDYGDTDEWHIEYLYSDLGYLYSDSKKKEYSEYSRQTNQNYTWKNGNLITIKETETEDEHTYTKHISYNNKVAPNINIDLSRYLPQCLIDAEVHIPNIGLYNCGIGCTNLFGMKNNNFITNFEDDYEGRTAEFSWTYDIYGFPIKCICSYYDEEEESGYQMISEFEYL